MDAESSTPLEAQPAGGATPRGSAQPARAYARGTTVAITAIWAVLSVAGLFALNTATAVISGRMWWLLDGYDNRLPLDYLPQIKQAESLAGSEAWLIDVPLWIRLISSAGSLISVAVLVTAGIVLHRIVFSHPTTEALGTTNLQTLILDAPAWPWWTLLFGVVAQAISLAFKSGAKLEKEVSGLV